MRYTVWCLLLSVGLLLSVAGWAKDIPKQQKKFQTYLYGRDTGKKSKPVNMYDQKINKTPFGYIPAVYKFPEPGPLNKEVHKRRIHLNGDMRLKSRFEVYPLPLGPGPMTNDDPLLGVLSKTWAIKQQSKRWSRYEKRKNTTFNQYKDWFLRQKERRLLAKLQAPKFTPPLLPKSILFNPANQILKPKAPINLPPPSIVIEGLNLDDFSQFTQIERKRDDSRQGNAKSVPADRSPFAKGIDPLTIPSQALVSDSTLLSPRQLLYTESIQALKNHSYSKAKKSLELLAQIADENEFAQLSYGMALLANGDFKQAAKPIRDAIELAQKHKTALPMFSSYFASPKDFAFFERALESYLRDNPHDQNSTSLLILLKGYKP